MIIKAKAVSPGIALGAAYVYRKTGVSEVAAALFELGLEEEMLKKFGAAVKAAMAELDAVIAKLAGDGKAKIFEAHKEFLDDEDLLEMISNGISSERKTPEFAVYEAFGEFIELLGSAEDANIAARIADLRDVRDRLIRVLRGEAEQNLSSLPGPAIVVAHDLMPSDTATLDRTNVIGIVTETGGATSHTAIIANSYGIPAVLGALGVMDTITNGMALGLDAETGELYIEPSAEDSAKLNEKAEAAAERTATEREFLGKEAVTADGRAVDIGINIGSDEKLGAYEHCDFVGLFRTEFLYMNNDHLPAEDEQYNSYKRVMAHSGGKFVTLRTLDIGGDKSLPYMELPKEDNPFLGNRALRLCISRPELLRAQLRAAFRAAAHGDMWIMFPMVGSLDDIRAARKFFDDTKAGLKAEGKACGEAKFGIMIEIPSIAAIADLAAEEVDFASIGTNDLCQYLCAADRMNPEVNAYYQSYSPAMVRVLGDISRAFNAAGKPLSVCGELAGEVEGAVLLAGLGYRKLSMSGSRLARVKAALCGLSAEQAELTAKAAACAKTEAEVLTLLRGLIK